MMQSSAFAKIQANPNHANHIEYSIYAYDKYCENTIGYNKWQCVGNLQDANQALQRAAQLFQTNKFQKIEVKKKFFDPKKKRQLVSTFRVFDGQNHKISAVIPLSLLALCLAPIVLFLLEKL